MLTKLNCVLNRYIKIYISQWQVFADSAVWSHSMYIWMAWFKNWNLCQLETCRPIRSNPTILNFQLIKNKQTFLMIIIDLLAFLLGHPFYVYFDSKEFSCNPIGKAFLKNSFELMLPDMPLFSTSRRKKKTNSKKTFEK